MTDRSLQTFRDTLEAQKIDLESIELRSDGTVGPLSWETEPDVEAKLPQLELSGHDGDLDLKEVIGEGGMGVVHAASQTSLQRTVAVKMLQPTARTPKRVRDFIREARVTGVLEHPNIVPIHGLAVSEDGTPWMVMKRVIGRSWLDRIDETFGQEDHLSIHLEVLLAVCNAVEAAHAQGILHRDLKPENVLVGDFGEVLLVDWGLAVAFEDPPIEDLPRAARNTLVVGTPRYMAPEMAVGDGKSLGPATDVYLLGATLHHILTGDTRHQGETLMELLYQAYASESFAYGPEIPEELGQICNRACQAEPADRYPNVAEFRHALLEYESHAGSVKVAAQAQARLDEGDEEQLTACRFGFEQALSLWPDNPAAKRGLITTLEREATRALDHDRFDQARGLIAKLERLGAGHGDPESSLKVRLRTLQERMVRREARLAELERTAHDENLGVGVAGRRGYGLAFGTLIGLYNFAMGAAYQLDVFHVDHVRYTIGAFLVAAAVGTAGLFRLKEITPNRAARRLLIGLAAILSAQVPVFLALGYFGIDIQTALAISLFQLGGSYVIKTATVDERTMWVGLVTAIFGGIGLLWPFAVWYLVGICYSVFFIGGALLPLDDPVAMAALEEERAKRKAERESD